MSRSQRHRGKVPFTKSAIRSAISNGRTLNGVDHRGPEMRRLRDLIEDMHADLGGIEQLSTAEQALVRRACMLSLLCELYERFWFQEWQAEPWKMPARETVINYGTTANSARRILESLGLQRRSRDITPTLDQYLRHREAAE